VIAHFSGQGNQNSNFNSTSFNSIDTANQLITTRLTQGGGLTGGGAALFLLTRDSTLNSDSGAPAYNFGSVTGSNRAQSITNGDFFSFTVQSNNINVEYETLSFFSNQFDLDTKMDISYSIDNQETFIVEGFIPPTADQVISKQTFDFQNFTSNKVVTWNIYLYGSNNENFGTRIDDLILNARVK